MRKLFFLFCFVGLSHAVNGQEQDKSVYLKGNVLTLPVLVFNAGAEFQLSEKYTLQMDGFVSPWKSFAGNHAQIYMGHIEGRYYFDQAFNKWYVGANTGVGLFDLTKWNYHGTDKFQRGFNFMLGVTVGYQWQIKENLNMDIFIGGGNSQSFYHGYEEVPPDKWLRYDVANGWNKSGEILPYRGGIMLSYKIK